MSSPFIVIDEITTKMNEINSSLTTKIDTIDNIVDTISSNTTTIINNTKTNNTASSTGTLSQKLSSTIANTATNNTASKTGTLSQKLSYLVSLLENSTYGLGALKNGGSLKIIEYIRYYTESAPTSTHTVCNISGKGTLHFVNMNALLAKTTSTTPYGQVIVTIDGVVRYNVKAQFYKAYQGAARYVIFNPDIAVSCKTNTSSSATSVLVLPTNEIYNNLNMFWYDSDNGYSRHLESSSSEQIATAVTSAGQMNYSIIVGGLHFNSSLKVEFYSSNPYVYTSTTSNEIADYVAVGYVLE